MTANEEIAMITFRSGYNCAQAVVTTFADALNFDYDQALSIAAGFGGGMGRLQRTCGAVTGAFMVISFYCDNIYKNDPERKDKTYKMIRGFTFRFEESHGTSICRELLGIDLLSENGRQEMKDKNLHESVCEKCVMSAARILDEMLNL